MKRIVFGLIGIMAVSLCDQAWATTDLETLGNPDVTISPSSGPPGTKVTITISNLPDTSKENYPYPDLYIYLPFSQPFGQSLQSHCGGLDCFPVYTYSDALKQNLVNRTITFSLPSTSNPNAIFLNGMENSVCDIILNGKTVERFSTLCNAKDEPQGTYKINLAWALESDLEKTYVVKTIQFTVTQVVPPQPIQVADNGDLILKEYQNGTISQSVFYEKLRSLGWNDEQIRQALAVIGKLPHQMGSSGPDSTLPATFENSSSYNVTKIIQANDSKPMPDKPLNNTNTTASEIMPSLQNDTVAVSTQEVIPIVEQNYSWNNMVIILSIVSASVMLGATIFTKKIRKVKRNA